MNKTTNLENQQPLKLNYKNTFYIGCAFFSILMLWQVYNHYCPLFLRYLLCQLPAFKNEDYNSVLYIVGIIMAADNLVAIFMLPIFGTLSDRTNTKFGKRMPYIICGMVGSAILFPLIAIMFIINSLVGLIIMMAIILIIMNIYRNPAVALMPDVTPKPLRSKANGIINFVGYLGAILAGGLAMFLKVTIEPTKGQLYLYNSKAANDALIAAGKEPTNSIFDWRINAIIAFVAAAIFMIIAMIIIVTKIKEKKLLEETKDDILRGELESQANANVENGEPLTKTDKKNIFILLFAVLFWFISFNAIETFNSLFCSDILNNEGIAGTITIILTISSIITFLLTVNLPTKIGRKKSVLLGLASIILGFILILGYLYLSGAYNGEEIIVWPIYIFIVFCGFGWALINANSYPMMVEMANGKNIGRFTGYYYTFSMLAQSITPIIVGAWMSFSQSGLKLLYIYAAITMTIAAIIFCFFKESKYKIDKTNRGFAALGSND